MRSWPWRPGAFTIGFLLLVAGCGPHPKKIAVQPPRHARHEGAIRRVAPHPHALSDAEKEKIFEGFEHWLATGALQQAPVAQSSQTARDSGKADMPIE